MHAITLGAFGPPQNLRNGLRIDAAEAHGQVVITVKVSEVPYVETLLRLSVPSGGAPLPRLPLMPGGEVADKLLLVS